MPHTHEPHSAPTVVDPVVLYQTQDGRTTLDVQLKDETVWLTQAQMVELFQRDKRTVSEHIRNIFKEGELTEEAVVRKSRTTAADGKSYRTTSYNLDVIISVGYRVKLQRGTQFRIWATSVLKDYLVRRYAHNQRRLAEKGIEEVRGWRRSAVISASGYSFLSLSASLIQPSGRRFANC